VRSTTKLLCADPKIAVPDMGLDFSDVSLIITGNVTSTVVSWKYSWCYFSVDYTVLSKVREIEHAAKCREMRIFDAVSKSVC
jgi:hypothetical protein